MDYDDKCDTVNHVLPTSVVIIPRDMTRAESVSDYNVQWIGKQRKAGV